MSWPRRPRPETRRSPVWRKTWLQRHRQRQRRHHHGHRQHPQSPLLCIATACAVTAIAVASSLRQHPQSRLSCNASASAVTTIAIASILSLASSASPLPAPCVCIPILIQLRVFISIANSCLSHLHMFSPCQDCAFSKSSHISPASEVSECMGRKSLMCSQSAWATDHQPTIVAIFTIIYNQSSSS